MTERGPDDLEPRQQTPPARGGSIMFWALVGLAAAVFAPCVLLPVWREHQALHYAAQYEQAALTRASTKLAYEKRRLAALQNDPATIARVARRELRFRDPEEVAIPVSALPRAPAEAPIFDLTPVEPPSVVAWAVSKLPEADYDRLFCHPPTRTLLMCLAGGLALSAFVIHSPPRKGQTLRPER